MRNWVDKKRNFEVIVGKSTLSFGEGEEDKPPWHKRFGFVQPYNDAKPKRCLHEVAHSQGLQMNQEMTFLADGHDTLRELQLEMSHKGAGYESTITKDSIPAGEQDASTGLSQFKEYIP